MILELFFEYCNGNVGMSAIYKIKQETILC